MTANCISLTSSHSRTGGAPPATDRCAVGILHRPGTSSYRQITADVGGDHRQRGVKIPAGAGMPFRGKSSIGSDSLLENARGSCIASPRETPDSRCAAFEMTLRGKSGTDENRSMRMREVLVPFQPRKIPDKRCALSGMTLRRKSSIGFSPQSQLFSMTIFGNAEE